MIFWALYHLEVSASCSSQVCPKAEGRTRRIPNTDNQVEIGRIVSVGYTRQLWLCPPANNVFHHLKLLFHGTSCTYRHLVAL